MKKSTIPTSSSERYYSNLPEYIKESFEERYRTKLHLYHSDKNSFEKFSDYSFFNEANQIYSEHTSEKDFPYVDFMKENSKRQYDSKFSYVIKWNDQFVILFWECYMTWPNYIPKWFINHIVFHDGQDHVSYSLSAWKNIYIMRPSQMVSMGSSWMTKDHQIYIHYQAIQHPDTISILKTIDKLKYLPIEKFRKVNYFHLLNATQEKINSYEMLLKMGATRIATGALLDRTFIEKKEYKATKDVIQRNRSYEFFNDKITEFREEVRQKKERFDLRKLESELQKKEKIVIEDNSFILVSPTSIKEMQHESNVLNHCLGKSGLKNYAQRIVEGKCTILFMRKKEKPDQPYFTVELRGDQVIQCRTNKNHSDPIVTGLLKEVLSKHKEVLVNA